MLLPTTRAKITQVNLEKRQVCKTQTPEMNKTTSSCCVRESQASALPVSLEILHSPTSITAVRSGCCSTSCVQIWRCSALVCDSYGITPYPSCRIDSDRPFGRSPFNTTVARPRWTSAEVRPGTARSTSKERRSRWSRRPRYLSVAPPRLQPTSLSDLSLRVTMMRKPRCRCCGTLPPAWGLTRSFSPKRGGEWRCLSGPRWLQL